MTRNRLVKALIARALHFSDNPSQWICNAEWQNTFKRFAFLWPDEWVGKKGHVYEKLPWYRPFNLLLHCWRPPLGVEEEMHDHPRWSITVMLLGEMTEKTPWGSRLLKPGAVVFRGRKSIHAIDIAPEFRGKTWSLFIVGPRRWDQRWYKVRSFDA